MIPDGMQNGAPQEQPAAAMPPPAEGEDSGLTQAGPEEQQVYDDVVGQALNLIYDRSMMPKIIEMLAGEGDPMEGLARATAMVIARVGQSAQEAGVKLTADVMLHATKEVFEDLANLAKEAKIKDFSKNEEEFEGAFFRALDQLRTMLAGAGRINQGAAQQDMARLEEMDQSGELEAMFTKLASADAARPKEGKPTPAKGKANGKAAPRGLAAALEGEAA